MIRQEHSGRADVIKVSSNAPRQRLTIQMPYRRPLFFVDDTRRKFRLSVDEDRK